MHTIELFEEARSAAEALGYGVRYEWLGGSGGGFCEFGGRKWIFIDLALNNVEQLEQVVTVLKQDSSVATLDLSRSLRRLLEVPERRAA